MDVSDDQAARSVAWKVLEDRGYEVTDVSSGSGVPRGSRLRLRDKAGKDFLVAVKKATSAGRISFKKDAKNVLTILPEMDMVIHVQLLGSSEYKVTAFSKATMIQAFEKCQAALTAKGNSHIPLWVNPHNETASRMAGSGFWKEALWSIESGSAKSYDEKQSETPVALGLEAEVIALIAKRTGYDISRIRVDIHLSKA